MSGQVLQPGEGQHISFGGVEATLKVPGGEHAITSTFELLIPPGFDVGAHYHKTGDELFYVVRGELELVAFDPLEHSDNRWWTWRSAAGEKAVRGGPGTLMHVPTGCPHAFRNPTGETVTALFQSSPAGHEYYFLELAELLADAACPPDSSELATLRLRHGIHQITSLEY